MLIKIPFHQQVGEMLHVDEFSLYEAMSAVEVGDPKLDAGMLAKSDRRSTLASSYSFFMNIGSCLF